MDDLQSSRVLEEIEQQVSVGLPQDGPHIISQEPVPPPKSMLVNILLALGILSLGTITLVLAFSMVVKSKKQIAQVSPTPTVITLRDEYSNPFDTTTQYSNPFSQKTNPFDNLSQ